ncbi:MAG: sulfite exporter TauE/SafE family protein [Hyphomicrobiales bacterium]|nr:sulfite exporter TauE/SafE family protein [Hyphomicrobiales bacterium]
METLLAQLPQQEILLLVFGALLAGIASGGLAGLLGVGGGTITVAFLYYIFSSLGVAPDHRMHLAIGTSLATIIPVSLHSMHGHRKAGAVDADLFRGYWLAPLLAGAILGGALNGYVPDAALRIGFAAFIAVIGVYYIAAGQTRPLAPHLPPGIGRWALGCGNGLISSSFGVGGGALGVVAMTAHAVPIHKAVGTSAGFGAVIAVPASLGYILSGWNAAGLPPWSLGYVNLAGFALVAPGALVAARLGVRIAHKLPQKILRRVFAAFLIATAAYMMFDSAAPPS